jgi:hypothetical protein
MRAMRTTHATQEIRVAAASALAAVGVATAGCGGRTGLAVPWSTQVDVSVDSQGYMPLALQRSAGAGSLTANATTRG